MKRKALSTLLALCMVMALLPTAALAAAGDGDTEQADGHVARATVENTIKYYTTLKAAVDAADTGSIVSLLADVTIAAEANIRS